MKACHRAGRWTAGSSKREKSRNNEDLNSNFRRLALIGGRRRPDAAKVLTKSFLLSQRDEETVWQAVMNVKVSGPSNSMRIDDPKTTFLPADHTVEEKQTKVCCHRVRGSRASAGLSGSSFSEEERGERQRDGLRIRLGDHSTWVPPSITSTPSSPPSDDGVQTPLMESAGIRI